MCEAFAKAGHDVTLLAPYWNDPLVGEDAFAYAGVEKNFTIKRLSRIDIAPTNANGVLYWVRTISFLVAARMYLWQNHFDIVYTREALGGLFVPFCVYEIHSPPKNRWLYKISLFRTRALSVLTSGIRDVLVKRGYPIEKILVEPDAVDYERFALLVSRNEARVQLSLPQKKYLVGYVGTLKTMGKEKGVGPTIRALMNVPDVLFYVVGGEEPHIAEYKALAKECGVSERVVFTGQVPHAQVPLCLKAFDVVVAPFPDIEHYRLYMSPLKIFEYMAAGVPMIVTDLPSLRDVLSEESAFMIPPDNVQALSSALNDLRFHPEKAKTIAKNALELARTKYTWKARAERTVEFIGSVV